MTPKFDVFAIGTLNVDLIILGDAPREMEQLTEWVAPAEVEFFSAGSVGYCAVDLARLGLKVSLMSSVADDFLGRWLLENLKCEGVDTETVTVEAGGKSGIGIYMLLFGSRKRPLTGRLSTHAPWPIGISDLALERLKKSRLLHCGGYLHYPQMWGEPTEALYRRSKELGLITSMDPQFPFAQVEGSWLKLFGSLLSYIDILFTDEIEARSITGQSDPEKAAAFILEQGPKLTVVKMGQDGALIATRDKIFHQPALQLEEFKDSIGAGDAFDAGMIYGELKGWEVEKSAKFAASVAVLTLRGMGGTQSAPRTEEALRVFDTLE